jgi:excisionase family DNA binding protein
VTEAKYLTPAQVAELLNVSKPVVMRLAKAKEGGLPVIQLGPRVYRFKREAVEAWLTARERRAG